MAGGKWAQKIQLGREVTAGTAVAASTIWRGAGGMLADNRETTFVDEMIGQAWHTNRTYTAKLEGGLSMAETPATYEQLPHILEAGIETVTPTQDGAGTDYIYDYQLPQTTANTIKTYTIETGDNQQAEEMEYSFVESFTISGEADSAVMMAGEWIGRQVANSTFTGALSTPTVEDILASTGALYIDDTSGSFGGTQVTGTLLGFELAVTTGWAAKYTVDNGQKYFDFSYFNKDAAEAVLTFTFEHNATTVSEKGDWRTDTPRAIQLRFDGSAVGTPGTTYSNKTLIINAAGNYESFDALSDQDGNSIYTATFRIGYDATIAEAMQIIVVNELTALP